MAEHVAHVGDLSALGLPEVQVVDGGEPAQKLTVRALQRPDLEAVAPERRPRAKPGQDLVAGPRPASVLARRDLGLGCV